MTIKNHDQYLDPPDGPEVPICESCGHYMEQNPRMGCGSRWLEDISYGCKNSFCPDKHNGIAKEMAERVVELTEKLEDYKTKLNRLSRKLSISDYLLETKK